MCDKIWDGLPFSLRAQHGLLAPETNNLHVIPELQGEKLACGTGCW